MNNKIGRTCNFTVDDKSLLLDLVKKYGHIVENKKTDATTTKVGVLVIVIGVLVRRNDGTADGTAISKYIGRGSRRNSNKLDWTTERQTIRANQCSRSAIHC